MNEADDAKRATPRSLVTTVNTTLQYYNITLHYRCIYTTLQVYIHIYTTCVYTYYVYTPVV